MRISRKVKSALLAVVLCSSAAATDQLYAGISLGKSSAIIDLDRAVTGAVKMDVSHLAGNAPVAGVFLGYDHLIPETPLFVGFEASAQVSDLEVNKKEDLLHLATGTTKAELNHVFSGVLKLGIAVKDLLFYAKTGLSHSTWKYTLESKDDHLSKKSRSLTPVFGLGIDYNLNKNWSLGVDHTFTKSKAIKFSTSVGDVKLSPALHTTNLRLMYRF